MISSLRGVLTRIEMDELVLEVGGVGFAVAIPGSVLKQLAPLGDEQFLYTYLAVREDALQLYGFLSSGERKLFLQLIEVSGVGPRTALAALSSMEVDMMRNAIASNQPEILARVPGIGRKTAERIIFQLRDKMEGAGEESGIPGLEGGEVVAALRSLGYSLVEAQIAMQAVPDDNDLSLEDKIRLALQALASGKV
ncbi:MAG: Holliday junction branch migration protein RuvA [Anaerolineales bacterium]|nr:Holliday junction branch migration protein RuvA [Anaerolineales bacterium]